MILLVHSETTAANLERQLGRAEYSYYFVLREFRPVLERIGLVVPVADPSRDVDRIWRNAKDFGQDCVFLSFSPPHRTEIRLACPTIPVFAWEFDTLPNEVWDSERRNDWCFVLRRLGRAVVHSAYTAAVVRTALGKDFPVTSIPSPVWDRFAPKAGEALARSGPVRLFVRGTVIDSRETDFAAAKPGQDWTEPVAVRRAAYPRGCAVQLDGVVYSSVFNPEDGRKNWTDMVASFCRVFADEPRVTLLLKLTHHDGTIGLALLLRLLYRLAPFECRVVLMHGFLGDADYAAMAGVTTYVVNAAHGEGQCLPLMEFMSAGKPAIAPAHTGMSDYISNDCAFIVESSGEPTFWPQDPRRALRAFRQRIDIASLDRAFRESFDLVQGDARAYAAMSRAAIEVLRRHCSIEVVEKRLRELISASLSTSRAEMSPLGSTMTHDA